MFYGQMKWIMFYGQMKWTMFYGQMKGKLSFLAATTQGKFGVKRRMTTEKNLIPLLGMVEGLWGCGAVFPPKALGLGQG